MLPRIDKILYASDLGEHAPRVFAHAVALAQGLGATITFLHALEPLGPTGRSLVRNIVPKDQLERLETEGLARVRTQIRDRIDAFCKAELGEAVSAAEMVEAVHIVEAAPAQAILDTARETAADLIVLGAHGRGALSRAFIGSVAQKVVAHADRPVLLVPLPQERL